MPTRVRTACETHFEAAQNDCSRFARNVASDLGVTLAGQADDIVGTIRSGGSWESLPDGPAAAAAAAAGHLVVAGLRGNEQFRPSIHGHVVVVVPGPLARDAYPTAYWGSLAGKPGKEKTVNFAWTVEDRDRIAYARHLVGEA